MAERAVRWSLDANNDLEALVDFLISRGDAANAAAIVQRLQARAESLATMPERGRRVPEIHASVQPVLQELIEDPWRLIYAIDADHVLVVALVDSRRDVTAFLHERLTSRTGLPS